MDECRKQFECECKSNGIDPDSGYAEEAYEFWQAAWNRRAAMQVPEGWKLVPIEPTEEMLVALGGSSNGFFMVRKEFYKAMLAAAPEVKP